MNISLPFSRVHLGIAAILLVILAMIPSLYFFRKYQAAQRQLKDPASFAKDETKKLVDMVGNLIMLPPDEDPTVATVTEKDRLGNQPFFAQALNGDKLLIYTNAKKAILYRPDTNKIIEVAPVNIGPAATESAAIKKGPSFILLNGTETVGLTKAFETIFKSKVLNATVVDRDNASKRDYAKSILVDLTGTKSAEAVELGKTLGIDVAILPEGETKPTGADFLIILGADKK